jgi:raffinose/stachyose/melibiose transport system permease protein/N-acetylglucosamine transport system permease protein
MSVTETSSLNKTKARPQARKINWTNVMIYTILGAFSLSTILAFAWVIMISLKTTTEFLTSNPFSLPKILHFNNYIIGWQQAQVGTYFGNSVMVATSGAVLSVLVSALAAYVLARIRFKFTELFANYFLVGYMIPLMLTFIPLYFMLRGIGIKNGLIPLVLLYVASGIPFNSFILRGFFESLPSEMEEAAAVDGASPFRTFWQIMLPLAWPGLVSTFLINFVSLWNEFFLALVFLKQSQATLPLGLFYMAQSAEYTAQWTYVFAAIIITTVPILIVFALLQDQITKGMTEGALKG